MAIDVNLVHTLETIDACGDGDVSELHRSHEARNLYSVDQTDRPSEAS